MSAKKIVLVALGKSKAAVVKSMLTGDIDPHIQASILRVHQDTVILLDRESSSLL